MILRSLILKAELKSEKIFNWFVSAVREKVTWEDKCIIEAKK